jgi:hypothetical protein
VSFIHNCRIAPGNPTCGAGFYDSAHRAMRPPVPRSCFLPGFYRTHRSGSLLMEALVVEYQDLCKTCQQVFAAREQQPDAWAACRRNLETPAIAMPPWASYAVIVALAAVLVAMAFDPNRAGELAMGVVALAIAVCAYLILKFATRADARRRANIKWQKHSSLISCF